MTSAIAHAAIRQQVTQAPLVRGLDDRHIPELDSTSPENPVVCALFWGFRKTKTNASQTDEPLHHHEVAFIKQFKEQVQAFGCRAALILADEHARHNGIQKDGEEGYAPYYQSIEHHAKNKGIKCHYLSDILTKLEITIDPSKAIDQSIPKDTQSKLIPQAKHLVDRYPKTFESALSQLSTNSQRHKLYKRRAKDYAKYRLAEGAQLLPRLGEFFGSPVIPTHVADPAHSRALGLSGLYLAGGIDDANKPICEIPWKNPEERSPSLKLTSITYA